jgi:hypothetical protein
MFKDIIKRSDFARLCGITSSNVTTYIQRGKIEVEPDGKHIDTTKRINQDFIELRKGMGKGAIGALGTVTEKNTTVKKQSSSVHQTVSDPKILEQEGQARMSKYQLDIKKTEAEIEKKLVDTEVAKEKLQALRGNNIPIGIVKEIISQLSKSFINGYKAFSEQQIAEFCHQFKVSDKEKAALLSSNIKSLNLTHQKCVNDAKKHLRSHVVELRVSSAMSNDQEDDD